MELCASISHAWHWKQVRVRFDKSHPITIMWKSFIPFGNRKLTGHRYATSNFLIKFLGGERRAGEGIVVKLYPIHDDLHFSVLLCLSLAHRVSKLNWRCYFLMTITVNSRNLIGINHATNAQFETHITPKDHVNVCVKQHKTQIWHRQKFNLTEFLLRVYTAPWMPSGSHPVYLFLSLSLKRDFESCCASTTTRNDDILWS